MNPEPTDFVLPVRAVTPRIVQPSEEVCCFKTCELHVCGFQLTLRGRSSAVDPGEAGSEVRRCCKWRSQVIGCDCGGVKGFPPLTHSVSVSCKRCRGCVGIWNLEAVVNLGS